MTDLAKDVRFWDRTARKYARTPIKDMAGYERTLERTRELLRPSDVVLELGCGTGTSALRLAPSVARIIATDVSPEMIAVAREKAAAQQCANVEFVASAADQPQGPDGSFDVVLAFNVLHLIIDRRSTWRVALQHLKPGGLFVSKTACLAEMNPLIRFAIPLAQRVGLAPAVAIFSGHELEREASAAGLAVVETRRDGSGRNDPRIVIVARKSGADRRG